MKSLTHKIEKSLDSKRYEHTLGVAYTAAALAMAYGADIKKAQIAGLLHDCAKCMEHHKLISICEKNELEISDIERKNPYLLHAKVGSQLAKNKFDITDEDILQAILNHTTGRPEMSLLEKIIYIADYIEPNRLKAPNLSIIRRLAFKDIDKALRMILEDILSYLETLKCDVDPKTRLTYEYYATLQNGDCGSSPQ